MFRGIRQIILQCQLRWAPELIFNRETVIYDPTAVRGLVLNLSPTNGRYQSNDWITQKHVTHRPFMGRWKIRGLPATGIYANKTN